MRIIFPRAVSGALGVSMSATSWGKLDSTPMLTTPHRPGLEFRERHSQTVKEPDHVGLFGNSDMQNPRPTPQEKSETTSGRIRDLSPRLLLSVASTPPAQGPHFQKPA